MDLAALTIMKPLILYHGNCYDGFGAAWAAWRKFGDDAEYRPCFYGMNPPDDWWERDCYVLDFSFPAKVISNRVLGDQSLMLNLTTFHVIDHHKTAEEDLKEQPGYCTFDMNKSGAVLAWEFFHPNTILPQMLAYIQDRDLWKFELAGSREVSQYMRSWPMTFKTYEQLMVACETRIGDVIREGISLLRFQDEMVAAMCKQAVVRNIGGYDVPVANATVFFSEVGEKLCIDYPDAPFAAYYMDRKDGLRQWGLRSRNGFDVSVVAKSKGGGGHAAAAGFVEILAK